MSGGGKGGTTTQTVSIPPEVMARYNAVNARAENVAQTPFKQYGTTAESFVAPTTAQQQAGMQQTAAAANQAQPYYAQATQQLGQAQQFGQNYLAGATDQLGQAQDVGQGLAQGALGSFQQAGAVASPYYQAATQGTQAALAGAQPYQQMATQAALAGGQGIMPGQLQTDQYMSPYTKNVVEATRAGLGQQFGQQLSQQQAEAIKSGAFGGDRAGLQRQMLRGQQALVESQAISPLYQQAYNQALQTAQQQQGVGLGAAQANRAAIQQTGQQLGLLGQQGYGQQMGAAQQMANLGQQQFGQNLQTGQALQGLGQQQFGQGSQVAQQLAGLGQQGYGMGAGTSQALAGLGTGAQGAALAGGQANIAAGTVQQQTEQAGKQALYNQFLQEQGYPFQVAQFLANIAMGTGALSGSTTTTQQPTGFFSDEKLKHNKEKIGKLDDGQDIYRYDMGDGRTQIGLLAQEVEKRHPEAVGLAGGYKTVDYGAATDEAADRSKLAYGGMASEGGAVYPERAGLGFALGGSAAFDQDLIKQILANQQGMYSGLYGQVGTPRGAQGAPGGVGARIPASTLPVGKLATAGSTPQQRPSGFEQAVSTGEKFAKVGSAAKSASPYVFGGQNDKGERIPSIAERVRGWGQPEQGPSGADTGGKPLAEVQDIAKDKEMDSVDLGGKIDVGDGEEVIRDIVASGGRINKLGGGATGDEDNDAPEGIYKSEGPGINIPDDRQKNELMKPDKPPSDSGGGLGSALGTAASVAKLAMMFASNGGVVPRHHKAFGGSEIKDRNMAVPEQPEGLKVNDLTDVIDRSTDEERPRVAAEGLKPIEEKKGNFDFSVGKTLKFEGGLNPRDTNGTPSLYGINKAANPDVDFSTLTPQKAAEIYKSRYWDAIGGDNLSPELAHVAFDTAVIAGPGRAKKIMLAANGDPSKFLDLREQFQNGLIERNPEKYGRYGRAWDSRVAELRRDVEQGIPQPGAAGEGGVGPARLDPTGLRPQTQALSYAKTEQPRGDLPKIITEGPKDTMAMAPKEGTGVVPPRSNMKPGLAGPERNYDDPVSSPWRYMADKVMSKDTSDAFKSENFWIPLIAGVGSMLASKNPSLGGALGEGLVGGVAAYSAQQGQQADIAEKQARAEETMARVVDGSFKSINGILHVRILLPGGGYDWMPFGEYLSTEKKPSVDPRVAPVIRQMEIYQKSPKKEGDADITATPLPPANVAPPAPGRPKEEAPAAPATSTPPATPPAAPAPPKAAPTTTTEPKLSQSGVPLTVGLNNTHREAATAASKAMAGMDETTRNKALENDFFGPQQKVATAARGQQQQLIPMATVYASLPKDQSLATSGKAQEFLQPIVATLSNLAAMAGMPDAVINTEVLASQEKVRKLVSELQTGRLNEAQLKAAQAFRDMAQGIPDIVNTPGGQAKQMAQLLTSAQRQIDKDRFFADWQKSGAGDRGQFAPFTRYTSEAANRAFDDTYSEAFYKNERSKLEKMFKDDIPGTKSKVSGKEMTVLEYIAENGQKLGPKAKASIAEKYGDGVLRYFGIPQ